MYAKNGSVEPFLNSKARKKVLNPLISPSTHPSVSSEVSAKRNAYFVLGAIPAAALALGIVAFAIPREAVAFWPFFSFSKEVQAQGPSPVLPDPSLRLLAAATNTDPNPEKGACEIATSEGSALTGDVCPDTAYIEGVKGGGSISLYVVREGDTLSEIADMFDVSANTVLWANDLKSAKDIHPGDSLVILPVTGLRHKVTKGETLASLAKTYGGDADDIATYNGLESDSAIAVGTTVIIPGGEIKVATKATTSSKSGVKQGGSIAQVSGKGGGAAIPGYYGNPVPGAIVTQAIHGWNGVDLGAKSGTLVYASAGGTVIVSRASGWNGGYGNYVVIDHGNGTQTLYSHMSTVSVSVGAQVAKGAVVGAVGKTGEATGFHLHFEVRGAQNPFAGCVAGRACAAQ